MVGREKYKSPGLSFLAQKSGCGLASMTRMASWIELERIKRHAAEYDSYCVHIAIVISLVFSLTAVVIMSRGHRIHQLWAGTLAFAVPLPVALYFRKQIVSAGAFTFVAALIGAMLAAILFGL